MVSLCEVFLVGWLASRFQRELLKVLWCSSFLSFTIWGCVIWPWRDGTLHMWWAASLTLPLCGWDPSLVSSSGWMLYPPSVKVSAEQVVLIFWGSFPTEAVAVPDLACAVSGSRVTFSLLTAPLLNFSIFYKHFLVSLYWPGMLLGMYSIIWNGVVLIIWMVTPNARQCKASMQFTHINTHKSSPCADECLGHLDSTTFFTSPLFWPE